MLKSHYSHNFEMAEITITPVKATQVELVIFNKLFVGDLYGVLVSLAHICSSCDNNRYCNSVCRQSGIGTQ